MRTATNTNPEETSSRVREATAFISHGTTVATNALVTRRLPRAAMVVTRGFRDVIEIRRGTKEDLWDLYDETAPPYIRRRDRHRGNQDGSCMGASGSAITVAICGGSSARR